MLLPVPLSARRFLVLALAGALLASLLPSITGQRVRALQAPGDIFISELHYDNAGTDEGEFVEITAPAGTDLSGWSIQRYNGTVPAAAAVYTSPAAVEILPTGTIVADQSVGFGTVVINYPTDGLQNGGNDGLALRNATGTVIELLSWEGVMTGATGTPAAGIASHDIGVQQGTSTPIGASISRVGLVPGAYTWVSSSTNTKGAPNPGLIINGITIPPPGNAAVTVECGSVPLSVIAGQTGSRDVTATDPDGTVVSMAITSEPMAGITLDDFSPAATEGGTATATLNVAATTGPGTYEVVVSASNDDPEPQTDDCTLTVIVQEVLTVGAVQGQTTDAENGATDASPKVAQTVSVRGVVTQRMRFPTSFGSQRYGFFLQSTIAEADGDALSSDGIFVFLNFSPFMPRVGGGPDYFPVVGDQIVVRAIVRENFNQTELGNTTNAPALAALERSGATAVDLATEIETTEADPADLLVDANRFWERHEGMRFHVDQNAYVVAARDGFPSTKDAELWVIRGDHPIANREDPFSRLVYRDPHPLDDDPARFDNGNGMRIMLQSHGLKWIANSDDPLVAPANTHDTVTNELTGGLYFAFSKYGIEVEQQLELEAGTDPAANAPPAAADPNAEFATSDYNVENLYDFRNDPFDGCDFTGDPGCLGVNPPFDYVPASEDAYQKHLTDLAKQIAGPMHAPDLLMIQEAEDQDICVVTAGDLACDVSGAPGTNNADGKADTLQELALAIADAGGPAYDVAYDRDGADDRGIVSAFLFRTDTVELLPADADDPVLGSAPAVVYPGTPLAYNTDVSNPKVLNAVQPPGMSRETGVDGNNVYTRPPQVGHFRVWRDGIGTSVFTDLYALSNHFSSTPDARVFQRIEQAAYNAAIVAALQAAADGTARVISAGDYNVFPRPDDPFASDQEWACSPLPCEEGPSDQLAPMYDADLHNLWDTLAEEVPQSAYSYNFVGMVQTLDMQWATDAQFDDLVQVRAGHFNADFAADFDGDVARGASDHDPQIARWFTDVTFARMHALVVYYVATGDLPANREFLFHNRLDKAQAYVAQGKIGTAQSQLQAFGNQAHDYATPSAADAMAKEANRLASLL